MVLVDLIVYAQVYNIAYLNDLLAVIGLILFSSIACNLLYNYICIRYGYKPIIIYKLLTVLYIYFIPMLPNVDIFLSSFIGIIFPYFIYLVLELINSSKSKSMATYRKNKSGIITTSLLATVMILIIMLVSCRFKYGIMVIGSGSMTGAINKGDAAVYQKYDGQRIDKEDIIIFNRDDKRVVHRVVAISNINNQVRYYTKGDANTEYDEGYVIKSDIVGIVKFKVVHVGRITIWLKENFL